MLTGAYDGQLGLARPQAQLAPLGASSLALVRRPGSRVDAPG
jgi:hypothetical protein